MALSVVSSSARSAGLSEARLPAACRRRRQDVDQFLDQRRLAEELLGIADLLEVDLTLNLVAAVTLHAVLRKSGQVSPETHQQLGRKPTEGENQ